MGTTRRVRSSTDRYHIMARGVGRCLIFEDDTDREGFLGLLKRAVGTGHVKLHAWCLMDNHYHLLAEGDLPAISKQMRHLNSTHALSFNERHERAGHLFQGRYKSEPIESDEYFLTVLRYIHQNPLREGLVPSCDYQWSSFVGYMSEPRICCNNYARSLLGDDEAFLSLHEELGYDRLPLDIDSETRGASSNRIVLQARAALPDVHLEDIAGMNRARRDDFLRQLKEAHLSVRQIERLTGIARSVVARA